ncbi:S-adenosyl-L-methionine-dependent methyltransferase [Aspergillus heteromorphus CBS 117.55]|uniref:catechol O-methyltransferase n=1 Tax=Aspergillus heteromorphus CBS 117.55 TaxID=1448321 RepID=A0A317WUV9_9EURO|nr:S-adenosyl-L-methionine-dependent methyltransferase [Aspergillus heteromorphus CBS 117.55]PWY89092.1 S-adenosyl-L-methionine-dependent methyltransferase [Aspergillus heteromorphus CBS 117.55]
MASSPLQNHPPPPPPSPTNNNLPQGTPESNAHAVHKYILSQPQDALLNNPWAVYQALDLYSRTAHMMNFKQAKLNVAQKALSSMQPFPKVVLEFGTYIGCSAIAWAAILRDLNGPFAEGLHVYTFEVDEAVAAIARDFIKIAGVDDIVHVLVGPASESLKALIAEDKITPKGVDMAFFDHWEEFYLSDLQLCEDLDLFHEGSRVIADNTDIPGAPNYLAYVREGGRGGEGEVRFETHSYESEVGGNGRRPNIVEVSTVVAARL